MSFKSIGSHAGFPKPEKRIKKTLVTFQSTRTGKHVFLVDAEVDETGKARVPYTLLLEMQRVAKIGSNELFSFN